MFERCLIASGCLAPWLVMLKHHTTLGHVFRDMILDHVFHDMILFDPFDWFRAWEVFSRLGFCTVIVVTGKTCL